MILLGAMSSNYSKTIANIYQNDIIKRIYKLSRTLGIIKPPMPPPPAGSIQNDVLVGHDNFLFLYQGHHRKNDFLTGKLAPSAASIEAFNQNINERKNYCKLQKIHFLHTVFPPKQLIEKRKLSTELAEKMQSLYEIHYQRSDVLYFKEALLPIESEQKKITKENISTFRVLDSHLTDKGYFITCNKILEAFNIEPQKDLKKYFKIETQWLHGDMCSKLGSKALAMEEVAVPKYKFFFSDNRSFLKGNTNHCVISRNPKSLTEHRLLIFGDSYLHHMVKILSLYFRDILYVRSSSLQKDLTELYQPDFLITGNAERYLTKVQVDNSNHSMLQWKLNNSEYKPSKEHATALEAMLSFKNNKHVYSQWASQVDAKNS